MYEFIRGYLVEVTAHHLVLDVQGVGYKLQTPLTTLGKVESGRELLAYASYVVRENAITLYGFLTKEERNLFELLITLSGIGPKTALAIVGHLPLAHLATAIEKGHAPTLAKIPGIGKKTAERLIVDLKGKLSSFAEEVPTTSHKMQDALAALLNLGFTREGAAAALKRALHEVPEDADLSLLISTALKTHRT